MPEGGYKKFKIGDLFDIHPTTAYKLTNLELLNVPGDNPLVTNTSLNNGISAYIGFEPTEKGNMITFSDTTTSDAIFYQPEPFVGYPHVQGLYPRFHEWTHRQLIYIVGLFRKAAFGRFDYATKFSRAIAKEMEIMLPISSADEIDFNFMESRIRELEESRIRELEESRIRELEAYLSEAGFEDCTLTPEEEKALALLNSKAISFKPRLIYDDAFIVNNAHNILKSEITFGSGNTPYVTAGESNNSIAGYISYKDDLLEPGNSIMIGGKTMVITYQPKDFFSNDSHNLVLQLQGLQNPVENDYLFMVAALKKALSHKYHWGDSISKQKIKNNCVMVPVNEAGEIDVEFMRNLINATKKTIIARLKEFIAREHRAYVDVTHN